MPKQTPTFVYPVIRVLIILGFLCHAGFSRDAGSRPNIVVIMADDLGYECIGANGGTSYDTPNIDRLAAGGIRFDQMHAQPICTPSRVKLLTGKSNVRNYRAFGLLPVGEMTFAEHLRDSGYATCIVGKWQLGRGLSGPNKAGFNEYCLWQVSRAPSRYPNPGLEINGVRKNFQQGQYGPDVVTDYALNFMEKNRNQPFLLFYSMILPHKPHEPTPDSADWDPASPGSSSYHGDPRYFDDMAAYMDKMVGKIETALDDLGLRENTLILFTGDNGTDQPVVSKFKGRPVAGGKGRTTDAGTRVPFIANWPGRISAGSTSDDLLDFSDFFPSFCDLAGIEMPEEAGPFDGRSFVPQLFGKEGSPREWIYCWYARLKTHDPVKARQFVRGKRYKLYRNGEFYDLRDDVNEATPLTYSDLSGEARQRWETFQEILVHYDGIRPGSHW
ncbi:MAG: sulfatase-like hydrolase/transferase [Oceanipulchritudo sp.]